MNTSPCTAGNANHAPLNFSVDVASESKWWANWRMGRAWAPFYPELLGSPGTDVGERQWITSPSSTWVGDKLYGFIWPSCLSPSCQKAWTFRPPAISPGCLSTPEHLNFFHALSFAASAWCRVCKWNGWLSHESAFGICTLTFMWEHI